MSKLDDLITETSVTRRLVAIATQRAGLLALVGGPDPDGLPGGGDYSYASFATTVQAAAAGLSWRGLQPRDVVGVLTPDAVSFMLAVHAVRAAGGVPSPIDPGLSAVETAGQLAEGGARMIITSPPLADTALAAVDRSWVRQVFSFGEAAGATGFNDLLGLDVIRPPRGRPDDIALLPFCRGQDGRLRPMQVTNGDLIARIDLADQRSRITDRDVALVAPPSGDGLAYAALVDAALLRGATVVAARLPELAAAAAVHRGTVAVVPRDSDRAVPNSLRAVGFG